MANHLIEDIHTVRKQSSDLYSTKIDKLKGLSQTLQKENDTSDNRDRFFYKNFKISKCGDNLSNGERQIINFFRIMLHNNKYIFLDEATSNLDPITGKLNVFK